jgi:hypothetical protein
VLSSATSNSLARARYVNSILSCNPVLPDCSCTTPSTRRAVGVVDGFLVGVGVGVADGVAVGVAVGVADGVAVGVVVGVVVGVAVGVAVIWVSPRIGVEGRPG